MARDRQEKSPSDLNEQKVLNWSFDKKWKTLVNQVGTEALDGPNQGDFVTLKARYNPETNDYDLPVSVSQSNSSLVVSYNVSGDVVKIEKTINGTSYTKTISNADTVIVSSKTISAWSES